MKPGEEKRVMLPGAYPEKLFIVSMGLLCGIIFNHICHNGYLDLQGVLGGVISSILIIWLNSEE